MHVASQCPRLKLGARLLLGPAVWEPPWTQPPASWGPSPGAAGGFTLSNQQCGAGRPPEERGTGLTLTPPLEVRGFSGDRTGPFSQEPGPTSYAWTHRTHARALQFHRSSSPRPGAPVPALVALADHSSGRAGSGDPSAQRRTSTAEADLCRMVYEGTRLQSPLRTDGVR